MKRIIALLTLSMFGLVFAFGCGPLGGPAKGKELTELNENQGKRLCKQMSRKASDCDDYDEPDDCDSYKEDYLDNLPDDCSATAGDARECAKACGDKENGGCEAIGDCAPTFN